MNLIELRCPNCGSTLKVNEELDFFHCNSCGTKIINEKDEKVVTVNFNKNENINKKVEKVTRDDTQIELKKLEMQEDKNFVKGWGLFMGAIFLIFLIMAAMGM